MRARTMILAIAALLLSGCTYSPPFATVAHPGTATPRAPPSSAIATAVAQTVTALNAANATAAPTRANPATVGQAPARTATATALPTTAKAVPACTILYQAEWASSASGWAGNGWTYLSEMMVTAGTNDDLFAPYQPPSIDYTLEAEIQPLGKDCPHVGLIARYAEDDKAGLRAGTACPDGPPAVIISVDTTVGFEPGGVGPQYHPIAQQAYQPDNNWHSYRLNMKGNVTTVFVDGRQILEKVDNTRLKNGKIGVICQDQCNVRSFKVVAT